MFFLLQTPLIAPIEGKSTIDKRGSINLPSAIRKETCLDTGPHLDIEVLEGGSIVLTQKVQLTAGIYAAKALVQHLCKRFHDPKTGIFYPWRFDTLQTHILCVQEVLMYVCLLSFHINALFGLTPVAIYPTVKLNEKGVNKLAEARTIGTVGIIR